MQLEQLALLGEELWIFHTHTHIYALMHSPSLLACPREDKKRRFSTKPYLSRLLLKLFVCISEFLHIFPSELCFTRHLLLPFCSKTS